MEKSATRSKLDALLWKPDVIPPCWKTVAGWGEVCGLRETAMRRRINQLLASGRAQCINFRVQCRSRLMPIPHYRIPAMEADTRRAAQRLPKDTPSNPMVTAC